MSSRPNFHIPRHEPANAQELRRQRRVLAGMAVALVVVMALTVSAPFWASLYLCVRWGCQ